jgi:hypothetical protein
MALQFDLITILFLSIVFYMTTLYDQERRRTAFTFVTEMGETYTFHYGFSPEDLMCGLTRRPREADPELLGSAVPLMPLEIGKSALLGLRSPSNDIYLLETPTIRIIGPAADEFQPGY